MSTHCEAYATVPVCYATLLRFVRLQRQWRNTIVALSTDAAFFVDFASFALIQSKLPCAAQ